MIERVLTIAFLALMIGFAGDWIADNLEHTFSRVSMTGSQEVCDWGTRDGCWEPRK